MSPLAQVFGMDTLFFRRGGEDLGANGLRHFGGELFDEVLEEGGEVFVASLELILAVCEEGFEVIVGGGDAVHEVFEDEGESVTIVSAMSVHGLGERGMMLKRREMDVLV